MRLSGRLKDKRLTLTKFKEIILYMENEMCTLSVPLQRTFEHLGKESVSGVWARLFLESSLLIKEKKLEPSLAWKTALESNRSRLPLDATEMDFFMEFGENLGKSNKEMQLSVLKLEREKLSSLEDKAREASERTGKLYRNLGALAGAAVVILLI